MTDNTFSNMLFKSANGEARLKDAPKPSPWDKFLSTLDTHKMSEGDAMQLFARTLAVAKSDWKDSNDNTLLMHMASRGQIAIVKRLIHELYANVNAANKDGSTALHMAARGGYMAVCTELTDSNADPCKKDSNGSTPAMVAKDKGYGDIAEYLGKKETAKNIWLSHNTPDTR